MRLVLHTAAYWLVLAVREAIPKAHALAKAEFATIRLRLLKVAARDHRERQPGAPRLRRRLSRCQPVPPTRGQPQRPRPAELRGPAAPPSPSRPSDAHPDPDQPVATTRQAEP